MNEPFIAVEASDSEPKGNSKRLAEDDNNNAMMEEEAEDEFIEDYRPIRPRRTKHIDQEDITVGNDVEAKPKKKKRQVESDQGFPEHEVMTTDAEQSKAAKKKKQKDIMELENDAEEAPVITKPEKKKKPAVEISDSKPKSKSKKLAEDDDNNAMEEEAEDEFIEDYRPIRPRRTKHIDQEDITVGNDVEAKPKKKKRQVDSDQGFPEHEVMTTDAEQSKAEQSKAAKKKKKKNMMELENDAEEAPVITKPEKKKKPAVEISDSKPKSKSKKLAEDDDNNAMEEEAEDEFIEDYRPIRPRRTKHIDQEDITVGNDVEAEPKKKKRQVERELDSIGGGRKMRGSLEMAPALNRAALLEHDGVEDVPGGGGC